MPWIILPACSRTSREEVEHHAIMIARVVTMSVLHRIGASFNFHVSQNADAGPVTRLNCRQGLEAVVQEQS